MLPDVLRSFLAVLFFMTLVMISAWLWQRRSGNAGWTDVFWTFGTGLSCIFAAFWPAEAASAGRQWLVAGLGAVWSLRLGSYMAMRVAGSDKEDVRYTELRDEWGDAFQQRLLRFALIQAPATALLSLSVFAAAHGGAGELGLRDLAAAALLFLSIAGEATADEQMRRYKRADDRPPVMDRGLWGRSRHPNYFFEWLAWCAYPVMAIEPANPITWLTLVAPVIMYLVLRHGTGVPMLEKSMAERKGAAFQRYQQRVPVFFPSLTPPARD